MDNATTLSTEASAADSLKDLTTDISFEIYFYSDNSIDVYVWDASGSKPGTPTETYGANTPTASGDNFVLAGANTSSYNALINFDDLLIEDIPASGYANKVLGVASANIGKVMGVATANIAKVNGV